MTDIHFGGVTIPSQQTLSPATAEDIAFRPACSQLVPMQMDNTVFWTVTMSDGERRELTAYAPMPEQSAHFWLDAEGICKINGVEVPLVYTEQVPQRQVAQVTTTPAVPAGAEESISDGGQAVQTVTPSVPNTGSNTLLIAIGAPILLIIAGLLVKAVRGGDRRKQPSRPAPPKGEGNGHTDTLNDIFGGGQP